MALAQPLRLLSRSPSPAQPAKPAPAEPETVAPQLSVIIVNYCQWQDTAALIQQLQASACLQAGAVEIMLVDNHSPAHPITRHLQRWPGVELRRWGRNRGFARAVNEGGRLGQGRWFLLLNPDICVPDDFVENVLVTAERLTFEQPRAGIIGFGLRDPDGSRQFSWGPFPTLASTLVRLLLPRRWRKYATQDVSQRRPVPWVTGCCLLIRRDCFLDLGGLDNSFFLYYEDVDLCRRAWMRDWSVWYEPTLDVIHGQPLHARQVSPALRLFTRHALLTYSGKHWPLWQSRILASIVRCEAWARQGWAAWHGDTAAAACFAELRGMAAEMTNGQRNEARQRLNRIARQLEQEMLSQPLAIRPQLSLKEEPFVIAPLDRHPQPLPSGFAAELSGSGNAS